MTMQDKCCEDMAVIDLRPRAGLAATLRAVALRTVETVLDWQERTRQRYALRGLDDHMLKDIGLTRADVEHETGKRFWQE